MPKSKMRDLVVLIPGIMGSVLQREGKDLWAVSGQSIWRVLLHQAELIDSLSVKVPDPSPQDLVAALEKNPNAYAHVGDNILATSIMPDFHMIPGLWKVDGYSHLRDVILNTFDVTHGDLSNDEPANFFEFPYDWRRDNRVAAYRMKYILEKKLKIWRESSGATDAKLVLLAHSMGGLVSRYYLEVLEGWHNCLMLVTFGTPYRGSLNAVNYLVNGFKIDFANVNLVNLTQVVRTCPSVYQLLPTYQTINVINGISGQHKRVDEVPNLPNLDFSKVQLAKEFHSEIAAAVAKNQNYTKYLNEFHIEPIVGIHQTTQQSAAFENGQLTVNQTILNPIFQDLAGGDGTVPRVSAIPSERLHQLGEMYVVESHGAIQRNDDVLNHVTSLLQISQSRDQKLLGSRSDTRNTEIGICLQVEDLYLPEEPIQITASVIGDGNTPLQARLLNTTNNKQADKIEFNDVAGWTRDLSQLDAGVYRIEVSAKDSTLKSVQNFFEVVR